MRNHVWPLLLSGILVGMTGCADREPVEPVKPDTYEPEPADPVPPQGTSPETSEPVPDQRYPRQPAPSEPGQALPTQPDPGESGRSAPGEPNSLIPNDLGGQAPNEGDAIEFSIPQDSPLTPDDASGDTPQ